MTLVTSTFLLHSWHSMAVRRQTSFHPSSIYHTNNRRDVCLLTNTSASTFTACDTFSPIYMWKGWAFHKQPLHSTFVTYRSFWLSGPHGCCCCDTVVAVVQRVIFLAYPPKKILCDRLDGPVGQGFSFHPRHIHGGTRESHALEGVHNLITSCN